MVTLALTRGAPASGKTTAARAWVAAAPEGEKRARVNRDDLRASLFGAAGVLDYPAEQAITAVQQATVRALLTAGTSVVVDDMNLRAKYARAWADLAAESGAEFDVWDFTDVPLADLIARDIARSAAGERGVGEAVIRDIHAKFLGRPLPPITTTPRPEDATSRRYVPDESLPPAWIVDVDGTLALMGDREPFDWARVSEDQPNIPVVEMVTHLSNNAAIVVMSGRDGTCREDTAQWLDKHVTYDALHMRAVGDTRKDAVIKAELFWEHVAPNWNVRGVIDDRDQVVTFWRSLGLMCAQVAPGAF